MLVGDDRSGNSPMAKNGLPFERARISNQGRSDRLLEDPGEQLGQLAAAQPAQLRPTSSA
jgi:hypothetical protein